MASVARLQSLPSKDPRPQRLHWVGPIGRSSRTSDPVIAVQFVPFNGTTRRASDLLDWGQYDWNGATIVQFSVGHLAGFSIGSLWTAGIREEYPDYELLTVDVNVTRARATIMAPRERTRRGNYIIPRANYPISPLLNTSRVVMFPIKESARAIVIPCSEIFRFYYGPTSKLSTVLLNGNWLTKRAKYVSAKASQINLATREAYVQLGKSADDIERREIARMLFDPIARDEANSILPRAIAQKNGDDLPLIIRPPFEGETRLQVRGLRYTIGGHDVFLVSRIERCSGPLPWDVLLYNRDNPGTQGRTARVGSTTSYAGAYRRSTNIDGRGSVKIESASDPSHKDIPFRIHSGLGLDRYATPSTDRFEPRGPIETSGASAYDAETLASASFAIGSGTNAGTARAAAFVPTEAVELPHKLSLFRSAVLLLPMLNPGITLRDEDVFEFAKPFVKGEVAEPTWAYLDRAFRQQPRRIAMARISFAGSNYVLVDVESRVLKSRAATAALEESLEPLSIGVFRSPLAVPIDDIQLWNLREELMCVRGVIGGAAWALRHLADWRHAWLKHIDGKDASHLAARIIGRL